MTRGSPARIRKRLQLQKLREGRPQITPEEARRQLAEWAARGGDVGHLQRTGEVRMKPLGPIKMTTLAEMRTKYDADDQAGMREAAEEAAAALKGPILRKGG